MTQYTPQHLANYFLDRAEGDGESMTPMKLIKLVYIGYGWLLALTDWKAFDEEIEAWEHGPVIPSIYHEFKKFGRSSISGKATDVDLDSYEQYEPEITADDEETCLILDRVWRSYKPFTGWALRNKTHEPNTPWSNTYDPNVRNAVIPDEEIQSHFRERIRQYIEYAG